MAPRDINIHLGKQLRARRTMLGLSQEAIGKGIGVASQQVQKYEKGTNVMNAIRLYEFAQFLRVEVAYFYEGLEQADMAVKSAAGAGFSEEHTAYEDGTKRASDRETLEVLKSFKRIQDHALRKRVADLLRTLSLKDI